jgi:hypothetical protein
MTTHRSVIGLCALSLCVGVHCLLPPGAQAQALAFVKASEPPLPPTTENSQPGASDPAAADLVDHAPTTAWCVKPTDSAAAAPSVQFVFKHPVKVDRIVVTQASDEGLSPLQMAFSSATNQVDFAVDPVQTTQYDLKHAMQGTAFTLQVRRGEPLGSASPICLAEVALFYRGQELTGPDADAAQKALQPSATEIVGRWAAGPLGASEATLVVANDGTWSLTQEPLQGAAAAPLAGTYRFVRGRLFMRLGAQGKWLRVQVQRRRVAIDPTDLGAPAGDYDTLRLSGGLPAVLVGTYNNAQF